MPTLNLSKIELYTYIRDRFHLSKGKLHKLPLVGGRRRETDLVCWEGTGYQRSDLIGMRYSKYARISYLYVMCWRNIVTYSEISKVL